MGRSIDRLWEQKLGEAYVKRGGGRRDRRQLFLGQEIGKRDPPRAIGCFGLIRAVMPDPGPVFNDAEASDDKGPHEQPELPVREDRDDFRHRRTQGRLRGARGMRPAFCRESGARPC